jgi:methionine biosynthesis protein MetW
VRQILKSFGARLYLGAERANVENMRRAVARFGPSGGRLIDLGCGDGKTTVELASAAGARAVVGVERHPASAAAARSLGVDVVDADLDRRLPFSDASFDVVVSNQVIEHLSDTDLFVAEMLRVLAAGGVAVVSTENLASWHNIAALVAGFAPFSAINYSSKIYPLGNPISIHAGDAVALHDGLVHRRIFTTTSLRELFAGHGFSVIGNAGSGYYPFPAALGRIDPRHAHFITIAARKHDS